MSSLDYLKLVEPDHFGAAVGSGMSIREHYGRGSGVSYDVHNQERTGSQEAVRLQEELLLVFGNMAMQRKARRTQRVSNGTWIHIQFHLSGGSSEVIGDGHALSAHAGSCVIARYPEDAIIERSILDTPHWSAACLYFRPAMVAKFFGISPETFARQWRWFTSEESSEPQSVAFPMSPREITATSDLLSCGLRGDLRYSYMSAKAAELFTLAAHRLSDRSDGKAQTYLDGEDRRRVAEVHRIMSDEMDAQLTLTDLARRVGSNRSKLTADFRQVYGTSIQAYWRDLRLCRARELLTVERFSVAKVAAMVGYSEASCLTRSFERHFGFLPSDCRAERLM